MSLILTVVAAHGALAQEQDVCLDSAEFVESSFAAVEGEDVGFQGEAQTTVPPDTDSRCGFELFGRASYIEADDFFNLGVGLTATTYRGRSFYLFYDTVLARDDLEVGTFTLGARFEF